MDIYGWIYIYIQVQELKKEAIWILIHKIAEQ